MWEGWACLGGTEIVNSAMAIEFARSAPCPVTWINDEACPGIYDMLSETQGEITQYDWDTIADQAPWYNTGVDTDDVSKRFLGVYCISVDAMVDSTRSADVAERITKGAVIGAQRKGSRSVRYRVLLSAMDQNALDYGLAWLDSRLKEKSCSMHGGSCGTSDLAFFTTCSPAYDPPGQWVAQPPVWVVDEPEQTIDHPAEVVYTLDGTSPNASVWSSMLVAANGSGATGASIAQTGTAPSAGLQVQTVNATVGVNPTPAVRAWTYIATEVGRAYTVQVTLGSGLGGAWTTATFGDAVTPGSTNASDTPYTLHMTATDPNTSLAIDVFDDPGSATVRATVLGSFKLITVTQDAWTETIPEVGHWEDQPPVWVTEDVWDEYSRGINATTRILHGVKCTSGPLVQQKMKRGSEVAGDSASWGYIVEFTLTAEEPEIYGVPYDPDINEWGNTAVTDDPTNLVSYPSAEAAGAAVVVAKNFSTNPSVETNATGWTAGSTVVTPAATGARSTELHAVGAASFKVGVTATNSGTNGTLLGYQDVSLAGTIGSRPRFSFNVWGALIKTTGTAVLGAVSAKVEWRAGGTLVGTTDLGQVVASGGAMSQKSLLPPDETVDTARVIVTGALTSWSTGAVVALYVDALAVTTP